MILATIAIAAAAYLLGSIPTGYLLVRIFRREDIRSVGSGNIGATNVLRAGGKGLGAATFLLDMLKGCAAVWLGGALGAWLMPTVPLRDAQALAALIAVLGHMFTCWLHFRGGKGVATGFGVFLVASPWAALAAIGVFALLLALTRYVSLASVAGSASLSGLCLVLPARPASALLLRGRMRGCSADRRQALPEHPPPDGGHGIPPGSQENHMSRIAVLGSGAWGTALALSLCRRGGHQVTLWAHAASWRGRSPAPAKTRNSFPDFRYPPISPSPPATTPSRRPRSWSPSFLRNFCAPPCCASARTCAPASCWSAPPRAWRTGVSCA